MYRPAAFDLTDETEILELVTAIGAAHLVTLGSAGLASSVVPLLFDGASHSLIGHIGRANPQWRDVVGGVDALAIFAGPDAYVSPSFYPSKARTAKVVPTWNYEVVHASGELVVHDDPAWVTALVTRLTDHHESGRDDPWKVSDAPADYVAAMVKRVVGIELRNVRFEAKRKLSQNRDAADIDGTIAGLEAGAGEQRAVAAAMRRTR